jgi:hypothetical protein
LSNSLPDQLPALSVKIPVQESQVEQLPIPDNLVFETYCHVDIEFGIL